MVRRLVETRINKLLDELEAINDKYVVDTSSMSVIQRAVATEVNKDDIKRIMSIKTQMYILDMIFKDNK